MVHPPDPHDIEQQDQEPDIFVPASKVGTSAGTIAAILIIIFCGMGGPLCWWLTQIFRYGL